MTNRLVLGNKNGDYGLWVSDPGVDVFSADLGSYMISNNSRLLQWIASGQILVNWDSASNNPRTTVYIGSTIDFRTTVICYTPDYWMLPNNIGYGHWLIRYQWVSETELEFWMAANSNTYPALTVYYAVVGIPN